MASDSDNEDELREVVSRRLNSRPPVFTPKFQMESGLASMPPPLAGSGVSADR